MSDNLSHCTLRISLNLDFSNPFFQEDFSTAVAPTVGNHFVINNVAYEVKKTVSQIQIASTANGYELHNVVSLAVDKV
ncbi:MAG: hypothetical protein ACI9FB_003793 [Candidatus Azotimanducaceae bacterium]|jgi:hypothetical protein